jgi:transposase
LIVHHEVTTEPSDNRLLHPMSMTTKEMLGQESLTVVADAGYSSGAHASACERDGIVACVPANRAVNNQADGKLFDRSTFTYEPDTDGYRCPAGRSLIRKQLHKLKRNVSYMSSDCSGCALKPQCTTAERRLVKRQISGSQVRALVRPPLNQRFSQIRFAIRTKNFCGSVLVKAVMTFRPSTAE